MQDLLDDPTNEDRAFDGPSGRTTCTAAVDRFL
jgi:hypothetical protein